MLTSDHASWGYTSSTGLGFTHRDIVESHFAACAPAYRTALGEAGIKPGWRVLDAGCGSASFLPWLAELVGPTGHVSALDLAEENVRLVSEEIRERPPGCSVEAVQGDVGALPYPDGTFDGVWCANTTQYLSDIELGVALGEFARVVRPGGVVAVKDLDASLISVQPGDPFLFSDFFRWAGAAPGYARQLLRARTLHQWLKRAGLAEVRQRTLLIEHFAPFEPAVQHFYALASARVALQAPADQDPTAWSGFADPRSSLNPLRQDGAYVSEGNVVAVGTVVE
jgi:ubiquinone/menaquinone biosynthesis C-methylase UbiE